MAAHVNSIYVSVCCPNVSVNRCFCRKKVSGDYEALNDRLETLPEQLSYDIMVSAVLVYNAQKKKQTLHLCIMGQV